MAKPKGAKHRFYFAQHFIEKARQRKVGLFYIGYDARHLGGESWVSYGVFKDKEEEQIFLDLASDIVNRLNIRSDDYGVSNLDIIRNRFGNNKSNRRKRG